MTLKELQIGQSAVICNVGGEGALRQHFLDMGVIPGAEVTVVKLAPMGDPMDLQIHGYELTLRLADADQIGVEPIDQRTRRHEGAQNINQEKSYTLVLERMESIMQREMAIHFRKERY